MTDTFRENVIDLFATNPNAEAEDLLDVIRVWAKEAPPAPLPLDVDALGISDEQAAILRKLLASRQQSVSEWLGDVLMEMGLGRVNGRDYPGPMRAATPEPTVYDHPNLGTAYVREQYVATPEPTDLHPIVRGKQVLMDAVPATPEPTEGERP